MISLVVNELVKIYAKKSSWIYKILILIGITITGIVYRNINIDTTDWQFVNSIIIDASILLILFGVIVSSSIVSTEFTSGTIKQLLIRPQKRWRILLSKYIATMIYNLILTVVYIGIIIFIGMLLFDSGSFNEKIVGLAGDNEVLLGNHIILKVLYLLPGLLMIYTVSFMLSILFKNQSIAVGVGIFTLFFSAAMGEVTVAIAEKYAWAKFMIFPYLDLTVFTTQDKILDSITLPMSLGILTIYYAIFMIISFLNFSKRDVFV